MVGSGLFWKLTLWTFPAVGITVSAAGKGQKKLEHTEIEGTSFNCYWLFWLLGSMCQIVIGQARYNLKPETTESNWRQDRSLLHKFMICGSLRDIISELCQFCVHFKHGCMSAVGIYCASVVTVSWNGLHQSIHGNVGFLTVYRISINLNVRQ